MNETVAAWIAASEDPRAGAIAALCAVVERADGRLVGEIKWGAPSYRLVEHVVTTGLNPRSGIRLVLHRGVIPRPDLARPEIDDPEGLLDWKSDDRAVLMFDDENDVLRHAEDVGWIISQWIEAVED
jgi:hypothetical protein